MMFAIKVNQKQPFCYYKGKVMYNMTPIHRLSESQCSIGVMECIIVK